MNDNAWCQDNPVGWFDWTQVATQDPMRRFVAGLVALRQRHPSLWRRRFLTGRPRQDDARPDIAWQGADGQAPRWEAPDAHSLVVLEGR